ncbi:hypothetical protein [Xanthomarina gelatinilytica]|uniref:hypothetical protein n=1 Tax=Xanthomarina gelatinilytica TaxID=1137281 RepID=UPI003AA87817
MKNKLVILVTLFTFSLVQAQKEKIELPKTIEEIEFPNDRITVLFDVYLEKNGILHVKDSLVSYKQLGDLAFKFGLEHIEVWKFLVLAPLHIDKDTPYKYVDRLKRELHQSSVKYYYRTGHIEDVTSGIIYYVHAPSFFYRDIIDDNMDSIRLKPYSFAGYREKDTLERFLDNLYSKRFKKADSILKKMNYNKIIFLKNDSIQMNNKKFAHTEINNMYNEVKGLNICFISFSPDLLYKDYLKNISTIKKVTLLRHQYKKEKPYFFHISGELQKVLDNKKIKF